ncbi:MAG TPA: UvrD-helicase domain-containing protein, partial [Granulicella sp.]
MGKQPGAKLFTMPPRGVPDLDARSQALDVTRSWIVEAPAGSGKTGLLIQRYLRLLADASVSEPEEVLAITFTRAATEEIRDRILRELRRATDRITPESDFDAATRALADAVLLRNTQRSWRMLDEPRRLRVRTIDAVCAEIARALPILSGGGGSLRPIDEPATLYREAARRTWLRLGGEDSALNDALRTLLLHRDGDLERCEHLVAGMLADREQWGSLIPLRNSDLEDAALESRLRKQLNSTLERVVCDGLGKLAAAFPPGVLNALTRLAAEFSDAPANADLHPLAICSNLHDAPEASANHLAHWRALTHLLVTNEQKFRKGFQRNHLGIALSPRQRDALKLFVTGISESDALLDALKAFYALPPPEFPAEQWHVTKALVRVLRQALVDLQIVFAERGECDFAEPALLARYALDQSATGMVDTAIGTELKHLLVDEVQDTSIRQYELIERLTAGWASEGKTVFLVGDPKQSIYLFRQARVERFVATMNDGHLGSLPVGLLRLTANFRSQAGLVEAFNEDFSAIFPPAARGSGEIEYVSAVAARSETPGLAGDSGAAWHLSVAEGLVPDAKAAMRAETTRSARQVRRIIEKWRSKPLPRGRTVPWKIAVLVRSRASLGKVLPELRREPAIPVRAIKIDTLADRREIL